MRLTRLPLTMISLSVFALALCPRSCADDEEKLPQLKLSSKTFAGFAPRGYEVLLEATGDLNADKRDDAAIILQKKIRTGQECPKRCLIVALRGQDNVLRRLAANWDVLIPSNAGGASYGDPKVELKIQKGLLVLEQMSGSNDRTDRTWRYKLNNKRNVVELVGLTTLTYVSSTAEGEQLDQDLLTGLCILNPTPIVASDQEPAELQSYYRLACGLSTGPSEDIRKRTDWPNVAINLVTPVAINKGQASWSGRKDLSAKIEATYTNHELFLRTTVHDQTVLSEDNVQLVVEGQALKPNQSDRTKTTDGYSQFQVFPLKAVLAGTALGEDLPTTILATVQVVDYDKPGKLHCIMSTADKNGKHAGEVCLVGKEPVIERL